jgi:aspartate/glutamate racemase
MLIMDIKQNGRTQANADIMAALLCDAKREGADCAVIGCTDLTPAASDCGAGIALLDSSECLAKAAVELYTELKRGM